MAERSHLSIGEVLSLLQDDFPDVTISKIRFLESQGLLDPERTPSGYRKFYEGDIERLRWILRHQRDHFLPLKVIKERLEASAKAGLVVPPDEPAAPGGTAASDASSAAPAEGDGTGDAGDVVGVGLIPAVASTSEPDRRTPPRRPSLFADRGAPSGEQDDPAAVAEPAQRAATVAALVEAPTPAPAPRPRATPPMPPLPVRPAANPLDGGPSSVSLTIDELVETSGLSHRELGELTRFGLLVGYQVGGDTFYDGDAVVVARTAAGFMRFGIEARHLRMYKVAAEREAGFMEQVVMPLLKQRNPTARQQAASNLGELAQLGEQLRSALLRGALRSHTEPR